MATTMGFTPLESLPMGTRSGSRDDSRVGAWVIPTDEERNAQYCAGLITGPAGSS